MPFDGMMIMQITSTYNVNTNIYTAAREVPAPTADTASAAQVSSQNNTARNDAPINQPAIQPVIVDDAAVLKQEINHLLQQFSEWVRVSSESKRMELLYNLLLKESHQTSDLFGTIMDIARRLMRGEDVSLEEMRLLAEQNPQLFYAIVMLKEETPDADEKERRKERERRSKDRRSKARRRDYNLRSINQPEIRIAERPHVMVPQDIVKHVHTLIAQKTIKISYDNIRKARNQPKSINAVIMNPHDIAT